MVATRRTKNKKMMMMLLFMLLQEDLLQYLYKAIVEMKTQ